MPITANTSFRTADPYRDTDVIDARAPRFNQATVGVLSLVAAVTGFWPLLALLALQLAVGLRFGRRWCLACVAYFQLVQPRFGEGPIEDSRPPRFANQIGLVVLTAASVAHVVGLTGVGGALAWLVAALALLAASTGFCAGCEFYRVMARLRGIRRHRFDRLDLAELGISSTASEAGRTGSPITVVFSHPLCSECRTLATDLAAAGSPFVSVDVREHPRFARKYGIALVPTAVTVAGDGRVLERIR